MRGCGALLGLAATQPVGFDAKSRTELLTGVNMNRITLEPGKRGGRPCIRGLRITVYDVLSMLSTNMTQQQILDDFPLQTGYI